MDMDTVSRRTVLRGALSAAALAGTSPLLAACGNGSGNGPAESSNSGVLLPSYVPLTNGPVPDLPALPNGVLAGFLKYPMNPVSVTSGTPGNGSTVSAFIQIFSQVPTPESQNHAWQAMNKALGVNLDLELVPSTNYSDKLNVLVAGSGLPDLVQIGLDLLPNLPALLEAEFQDMTEFLGGDAIKEYPLLANIPTVFWKAATVYNGALYGIPIPRSIMGDVFYYRADVLDAKGLNPQPASYAEFASLCKELTDPKKNVWALTDPNNGGGVAAAVGTLQFIQQMLGVGNSWVQAGGKLTSAMEAPETTEALARTAELWQAGYIHPDSISTPTESLTTDYKQWFNGGSALLDGDSWNAWGAFYLQNVAGPSFKIGGMLPPAYDSGSKPVTWQQNPSFSFTAFKKASKSRIEELLRVLNWMAAPFGSAECLLKNDGVEGIDWTRQNGDVITTQTGQDEVGGLGLGYVASPPDVLYTGGLPQATIDTYEFMKKSIPMSVANPTIGLYSRTDSEQGTDLMNQIVDTQNAIIQGQQPLSSWNAAVKTWRSSGGDQIRAEYEKAIADSK
jgi:putative aldouronate transport system substrate-binding protein